MDQAAAAGAIIYPPVPAFYAKPETINDMVVNLVGRMLARIGIENEVYSSWEGVENRST
jgi:4-hydroxy-3-polyprenylbenzoate decarboxylase